MGGVVLDGCGGRRRIQIRLRAVEAQLHSREGDEARGFRDHRAAGSGGARTLMVGSPNYY